jgi:hypothetical protein
MSNWSACDTQKSRERTSPVPHRCDLRCGCYPAHGRGSDLVPGFRTNRRGRLKPTTGPRGVGRGSGGRGLLSIPTGWHYNRMILMRKRRWTRCGRQCRYLVATGSALQPLRRGPYCIPWRTSDRTLPAIKRYPRASTVVVSFDRTALWLTGLREELLPAERARRTC